MRMFKVAVVLLVLASFVAASTAVSMAAMATPTMKPMATMAKPTMAKMPKATTMQAVPNATAKAPVANTTLGTMPAATAKAPVSNTTLGTVPAATVKAPGAAKSPLGTMPNATVKAPVMPTRKPGMLINLDQMKSNIGGVYQMLKKSVRMPGSSVSGSGLGVKAKANGIVGDTYGKIAASSGSSSQLGVSAPRPISPMSSLS